MSDARWDSLFEDLENQFASERELEAGALAGEAERTRIAALSLRDRLSALTPDTRVVIRDAAGEPHRLILRAAGSDWIAGVDEDSAGIVVLRVDAIDEVRIPPAERAVSLAGHTPDPLRSRMGIGFVLRLLARRRAASTLGTVRGGRYTGTLSNAAGDHVDIALHDAGSAVNASREEATVAIRAIAWIRTTDRSVIEL